MALAHNKTHLCDNSRDCSLQNRNSHCTLHVSHTLHCPRRSLYRSWTNQTKPKGQAGTCKHTYLYLEILFDVKCKVKRSFLKILSSWKDIIETISLNIIWQYIEQMPGYKSKLKKMDIWKTKTNSCMFTTVCHFHTWDQSLIYLNLIF